MAHANVASSPCANVQRRLELLAFNLTGLLIGFLAVALVWACCTMAAPAVLKTGPAARSDDLSIPALRANIGILADWEVGHSVAD